MTGHSLGLETIRAQATRAIEARCRPPGQQGILGEGLRGGKPESGYAALLVHAGLVPEGAWPGDLEIKNSVARHTQGCPGVRCYHIKDYIRKTQSVFQVAGAQNALHVHLNQLSDLTARNNHVFCPGKNNYF